MAWGNTRKPPGTWLRRVSHCGWKHDGRHWKFCQRRGTHWVGPKRRAPQAPSAGNKSGEGKGRGQAWSKWPKTAKWHTNGPKGNGGAKGKGRRGRTPARLHRYKQMRFAVLWANRKKIKDMLKRGPKTRMPDTTTTAGRASAPAACAVPQGRVCVEHRR